MGNWEIESDEERDNGSTLRQQALRSLIEDLHDSTKPVKGQKDQTQSGSSVESEQAPHPKSRQNDQ